MFFVFFSSLILPEQSSRVWTCCCKFAAGHESSSALSRKSETLLTKQTRSCSRCVCRQWRSFSTLLPSSLIDFLPERCVSICMTTKQNNNKKMEETLFFFFFFFWWLYFWTAGIRIEQQNQIFHQIEGDSRNTIREAENTRLQLLCSPAWRANNRTEPPTEPPAEPAESFGLILWQVSFSCQRFLCVLFCFFTLK